MSDVSPEGVEVDRHVDTSASASFNSADLELVKEIAEALTGEGVRIGVNELPKDDKTPAGETKVNFDVSPEDADIALGAIQTVFEYRDQKLKGYPPEVAGRALGMQVQIATLNAGMQRKTRIAQADYAATVIKSAEQIRQARENGARKLAEGLAKLQKR